MHTRQKLVSLGVSGSAGNTSTDRRRDTRADAIPGEIVPVPSTDIVNTRGNVRDSQTLMRLATGSHDRTGGGVRWSGLLSGSGNCAQDFNFKMTPRSSVPMSGRA
mmetsp:Transcript_65353/g.200076  ORF Transcript_65353/g.200076 Transcript_65353/m.200076 type:complete len:105 (+) Transcript_65353:118-432(+)